MSFEEQINTKGKISQQSFVFFSLQICFATRTVLKFRECHSDIPPNSVLDHIQSLDAFRPISRKQI